MQLAGIATDPDGDALTTTWSKTNGPGSVNFSDASSPSTTATFSQAGSYTLKLTANDGTVSVSDSLTVTVNPEDTTPPDPDAIRINVGGPQVTVGGVVWGADQYYSGGYPYANTNIADIKGTTKDALYISERASSADLGSFSYAVPVSNGTYSVTLHFAEIYWGATGGGKLGLDPSTLERHEIGYLDSSGLAGGVAVQGVGAGKRVFSANLEGGPVELANYDINDAVGPMTAVTKTFVVNVSGGSLDIVFSASVNRPKLSALEIAPTTGGPPTNSKPVANGQTVSTEEDAPVGITLSGSDADGDALTYTVTGQPGSGTLSGTAPDLTYTPDSGFVGTDDFSFKVNDGQEDSSPATVTIQVTAQDDPNGLPSVDAGADQTITLPDNQVQLSGTATDPNGDALTITWSKTNGPGTVNFVNASSPSTTATFSQAGSYTLKLTANDGTVSSSDSLVVTVNPEDTTPPDPDTLRINVGGPQVTAGGVTWSADQYYSGGYPYANTNIGDIKGTSSDAVYISERASSADLGSFSYAVPVSNGTYSVTLHFAEIYWGATGGGKLGLDPSTLERHEIGYLDSSGLAGGVAVQGVGAGKRVFSANLEGGPVELVNYDINDAVGPMTAVTKTFTVEVADGVLDIVFSASVNRPKLSGLEITELP